jgi:hypothetical protein
MDRRLVGQEWEMDTLLAQGVKSNRYW